ncbi:hypothetical protein AXG93_2038s1000 [Marchantia polymorpha subsp. ruderalis]|uniref:Uncharacterized protein n=1 Tax=Marchantia polymorpha subsp. ruderalis TaxID=1480154 RepID=A0A176WDK4_MARPO|nr:hypothetical protein AXG93_2038s1000 [Marchantia polymorpha subsp. ruderalis]
MDDRGSQRIIENHRVGRNVGDRRPGLNGRFLLRESASGAFGKSFLVKRSSAKRLRRKQERASLAQAPAEELSLRTYEAWDICAFVKGKRIRRQSLAFGDTTSGVDAFGSTLLAEESTPSAERRRRARAPLVERSTYGKSAFGRTRKNTKNDKTHWLRSTPSAIGLWCYVFGDAPSAEDRRLRRNGFGDTERAWEFAQRRSVKPSVRSWSLRLHAGAAINSVRSKEVLARECGEFAQIADVHYPIQERNVESYTAVDGSTEATADWFARIPARADCGEARFPPVELGVSGDGTRVAAGQGSTYARISTAPGAMGSQ